MEFKNKTILVTGGAQGIGFSIAKKFIEKSAKVIILDIDDVKGREAVENLNNVVFIKCNLKIDVEAVFDEIIQTHKQIDVLVNNAGVSDSDLQDAIDINFTAAVKLSLKFYEHMKNNGGTIINISSILGYRVVPFVSVYQATKSAIIAFSRSLGHEKNFVNSGVRVIALCPGFTKTNLSKPVFEESNLVPDDILSFAKSCVWQDADSVGDAAVEVFKTASSGSVWVIEGGKLEEIKLK